MREAGQVGARRVAVELGRLLVERGHRQIEHGGIGPVGVLRALRHHDHERPAVGVVAHRFGDPDLRLPHAFGAALAPAVQEEDDGPLLAVVAPPLLRQVNLKAVGDSVQLDAAVQESRILRWLRLGQTNLGRGCARPKQQESLPGARMCRQQRAMLRKPAPGRPRRCEKAGTSCPPS